MVSTDDEAVAVDDRVEADVFSNIRALGPEKKLAMVILRRLATEPAGMTLGKLIVETALFFRRRWGGKGDWPGMTSEEHRLVLPALSLLRRAKLLEPLSNYASYRELDLLSNYALYRVTATGWLKVQGELRESSDNSI